MSRVKLPKAWDCAHKYSFLNRVAANYVTDKKAISKAQRFLLDENRHYIDIDTMLELIYLLNDMRREWDNPNITAPTTNLVHGAILGFGDYENRMNNNK